MDDIERGGLLARKAVALLHCVAFTDSLQPWQIQLLLVLLALGFGGKGRIEIHVDMCPIHR